MSLTALLTFLAIIFIVKGILIVKQAEVIIIERLGKFHRVLESGFNIIIPFLDNPRTMTWKASQKGIDGKNYYVIKDLQRIDLRETVYDFPRQNVITKDNVTISINALLYFQIVDPKSAVYEKCQNPPSGDTENKMELWGNPQLTFWHYISRILSIHYAPVRAERIGENIF